MIRANALTRKYGDVIAVKGVSFEIGPKEIVGLLGHNGAGKTTIMKMMTGYLEPSSGSVSINGLDAWSEQLATQRQIGYLPENCPLYPEMIVLDYLDYAAALRGVPEEKRLERIGYVIQKTNLISMAERPIGTLSRGYRQRLGVAQAILSSPAILILDEPTNGLDPSQILEMRSLIRELAETSTVVVSTHILQEVQAVCSRVIIINNGAVALDAAMSDIQTTGKLLIATDREPERCVPILEQVQGLRITNTEKKADQHHYTVVPAIGDISGTAAQIARLLIEHGCAVYALHPIIQDLESIFAEITTGHVALARTDGVRVPDTNDAGQQQPAVTALAGAHSDGNGYRGASIAEQQDGVADE